MITGASPIDLLSAESERRVDTLRRALRRSGSFSLYLVVADGTARREVLRRLHAWSNTGGVPPLHFFEEGSPGARAVERWLGEAGAREPLAGAVVPDGDALVADGRAIAALNVARDRLGQHIRGPCVLVLSPKSETELAVSAPDLFDVRAGTWELAATPTDAELVPAEPPRTPSTEPTGQEAISREELQELAAHLRALGASEEPPPAGALADAWIRCAWRFLQANEIGEALSAAEEADRLARSTGYASGTRNALSLQARALVAAGRPGEAEPVFREALKIDGELGDARAEAANRYYLADILLNTARLDEAQDMLNSALSIYHEIGDARAYAITRGRIADILQARGQLDEALRIRTQEEMPVYEKLGDIRERAVSWGRIADIFKARGQFNEALRIYTQEVMPVYEKLGDVHDRAVTWGRLADILQARGQLDEALRIRTQEEMPAYEKLGNVRERAITWGQIADILQGRGQFEEALRIRTQEEMPVYEKLGDVYALLITRAKLAASYMQRGEPGDRENAAELLRLAYEAAAALRIPEAEQIRAIQVKAGFDPT